MRNAYIILDENHLGELGVDMRIILKCVLKKQDMKVWTEFIWFRLGTSCESGEFLD
jgi:hypothetical protein